MSDERLGGHQPVKAPRVRRGLVIVYTGAAPGKTAAALGLTVRARGRGLTARWIGFSDRDGGEGRVLERLDVVTIRAGSVANGGPGDVARSSWADARDHLGEDAGDLLVLDALDEPLRNGWLAADEVATAIRGRPPLAHVVITGRDVPATLIDLADLVTDVRSIGGAMSSGTAGS